MYTRLGLTTCTNAWAGLDIIHELFSYPPELALAGEPYFFRTNNNNAGKEAILSNAWKRSQLETGCTCESSKFHVIDEFKH